LKIIKDNISEKTHNEMIEFLARSPRIFLDVCDIVCGIEMLLELIFELLVSLLDHRIFTDVDPFLG